MTKNKGNPKTADIYLSAPLLWSFLFNLALSSILKPFICLNIEFYPQNHTLQLFSIKKDNRGFNFYRLRLSNIYFSLN